jgi:hypothetical protein
MSGIGLLNEKPLHAALKAWYARPGDRFEVPVDGYVIDLVRDDLLVEIQTGNCSSLRPKLERLARSHRIRLVYAIAQEKWIVRQAAAGAGADARRKSPRRGRVEDLFWEMVGIPQLLANRNFSLEVLMIREEEARRYEGRRRWRRKGWVTEQRRLLAVVDRRLFEEPAHWLALLPERSEPFTARDLSEAMGIRVQLAQKMAYSLRQARMLDAIGRRGRANLYGVAGV